MRKMLVVAAVCLLTLSLLGQEPGDWMSALERAKDYVQHRSSSYDRSGGNVDARTDLFSTGIVLYECLTGRAPFEKSSNEAIMWAHVHEFAAPPSLLRR